MLPSSSADPSSGAASSAECIALIGASGGIGNALLSRLLARGAAVLCGGRDSGKLEAALVEARVRHPEARLEMHTLDARNAAEVDAFLQHAAEFAAAEGRSLTGAVNLAGSIILKPAHLTTDEDWAEALAQNANTAFFLLRAAARTMLAQLHEGPIPRGSIVLVSSVAAGTGLPQHEAIAAAKGAVEGLVRSAAATYAARGIRVNGVAPGLVATSLARKITSSEAALKASTQMHPMKRIGTPDDVAAALAFLLHPGESSWITGQILGVDGGMGTLKASP